MRFLCLFVITVAVFLIQAALADSAVVRPLVSAAFFYAIWVALAASGAGTGVRATLLLAWLATVLLRAAPLPGAEQGMLIAACAVGAVLLATCAAAIGRYVLLARRVEVDALFAAAVAYILLASAFGQIYTGLHAALPDSFVVPDYLAAQLAANPDELFNYFSFVTMATLGYGDIVPRHPVAQVLVMIETILGQLYLAIVVAWLVGVIAAAAPRSHPAATTGLPSGKPGQAPEQTSETVS
jgi:hypothetical protein